MPLVCDTGLPAPFRMLHPPIPLHTAYPGQDLSSVTIVRSVLVQRSEVPNHACVHPSCRMEKRQHTLFKLKVSFRRHGFGDSSSGSLSLMTSRSSAVLANASAVPLVSSFVFCCSAPSNYSTSAAAMSVPVFNFSGPNRTVFRHSFKMYWKSSH